MRTQTSLAGATATKAAATHLRTTCASTILLLLLAVPAMVQAQSPFGYQIVDGTITITFYYFFYPGAGGAVTIPSTMNVRNELTGTYEELPVTSIGGNAFEGCSTVTSVTIPDSVTSIGDGAFGDCGGLTSVEIPESVTTIANDAFLRCTNLTSVTIPDGVTSIGTNVFYCCSHLASVTIPDGVTSIGYQAFFECYTLPSVTIPDSVTNIGAYAFQGCTNLASVRIGKGVTSIGDYAFCFCTNLASIDIPDNVTGIGAAFPGCSSLASLTLGHSVSSIAAGAFEGCTSLTTVTFPASLTSIGYQAFCGCSSLTSVCFEGDAPAGLEDQVFETSPMAIIFYVSGATGWPSDCRGIPVVPCASCGVGGALQVTIGPLEAVFAGAQWSVDGDDWHESDEPPINLPAGDYTIQFGDIDGWETPPDQDITIIDGHLATATGTYYAEAVGSLQVTIEPLEAVFAGAQWSVDGLDWQDDNDTLTNLPPGDYTLQFSDLDGWNTPPNLVVTITDGLLTTATGIYTQGVGSLQVTIQPAPAIIAGARWQVDGGGRQASGVTVSGLAVGNHTVSFSTVSGWTTPTNQTVSVSANATAATGGTYVPIAPAGSLQVTISPASAIAAGAQWQVDGGAWQPSGVTVSGLAVGNHTVSFSTVSGWTTPTNQTVSVSANATTAAGGTYVAIAPAGSLQVTISPASAIAAGAQWQVDGGAWQASGVTVSGLAVGNHTVSFSTVSGWTTPTNQTVSVSADATAAAGGAYVAIASAGSLQVTISPASAIAAGAQWQVDGGGWQSSGATVANLSVGNHSVVFSAVSGWMTPASQAVNIRAGGTTTTEGIYANILTPAVSFSVTPSAVSNFYAGTITLQIGGLASGETVLVEKFRDNNGNGIIDGADTEVQQFRVTDGQASVFYDGQTAVTNFNVPGDLTPADGAITAQLRPALSGASQLTVAQYAFRMSSPTGRFAAITNLFNVTNSGYAQWFTGNVVCNGTNVPHALAHLLAPPAGPNMTVIASALADGSGSYCLKAPPGTYVLLAVKGGFVGDAGNSPVLALGPNATVCTNLSLLPATLSISGRFVDAADTNAGLPLVNVKAGTTSLLSAVGWTDGNGDFTLEAVPAGWGIWGESLNLDFQGYLGLQNHARVDTTDGNTAGLTIALARGTALVYGTVKDAQGHPLAGVRLSGNQNDGAGPFVGDATTDPSGNYAMSVNDAGVWSLGIGGNNPAFSNYVWSAGLRDTTFTNGQAVRQDFIGTVPGQGVLLTAPAWLGNRDFQFTFNTQSNVNYTIQYSTTLTNWTPVLTLAGGAGPLTITDTNAASSSRRFYRVNTGP